MSTLIKDAQALKAWFESDNLRILLADGRQIAVPLSYFPRLLKASNEQRHNYIISGGGTGLHWDEIDEDISIKGLLLGVGDLTQK